VTSHMLIMLDRLALLQTAQHHTTDSSSHTARDLMSLPNKSITKQASTHNTGAINPREKSLPAHPSIRNPTTLICGSARSWSEGQLDVGGCYAVGLDLGMLSEAA
jgi:hypothetical protein